MNEGCKVATLGPLIHNPQAVEDMPAWKNSDTLKEHFKEVLKKRETNLSINFKHEKQ